MKSGWRVPFLGLGAVMALALITWASGIWQGPGASAAHQTATPAPHSMLSAAIQAAPSPPASVATAAQIPTPTLPPGAEIFSNPYQTAYEPDKGFAPDAQRLLDLVALQLGLEKYQVAKGTYPPTLADLFPSYAPAPEGVPLAGPPVDPTTRRPYVYKPSADGSDYELVAVLDTGKDFTVTKSGRR